MHAAPPFRQPSSGKGFGFFGGRGFAPDAPLTVGDVRTTASQFLFYGEYSYAQTGGF